MISQNNKILIVDDDNEITKSLGEILSPSSQANDSLNKSSKLLFDKEENEEKKFSLSFAHSSSKALEIIKNSVEEKDPFAVLFIDIRMPNMDGVQAASKIRELDPFIEINFMTAFTDYSVKDLNNIIGANISYLTKPFSGEDALQLAKKSLYEWNSKKTMLDMGEDLTHLQSQISNVDDFKEALWKTYQKYMFPPSLAVLQTKEDQEPKLLFSNGEDLFSQFKTKLPSLKLDRMFQIDHWLYIPLGEIALLADFEKKILNSNETFFLQFLSNYSKNLIKEIYLKNELEVKERLSKLGEGISFVTHDIKATLNTLTNASQKARDSIDQKNTVLEMLALINQTCQDFESFLSQIQETAKSEPLKKVSINVADLFNELNEQYTISSSVPIEFKEVQGNIKADHLNLKRALINIINNAVNSIESNSASITVDFKDKEGKAHFFIKDNGPGIEPSLQEDLFGPFTKFKKTQGIGIGCSISFEIIKRHEGHIELKSKKGETEVKVIIPQK